jgi:23S rRNA (adenine2030-N6)-methyltransferase
VNYRHHYHAGNFADVFKHVVLLELARGLQRKAKGFLYLDTHAGRGRYDLAAAAQGLTQARAPEWPDGVGRLTPAVLARADVPAPVRAYLDAVAAWGGGGGEKGGGGCSGSPWLMRMAARPQDRLMLCEAQPDEATALAAEFSADKRAPRVTVQAIDGYTALRAALPPPEKRALVLIDPPFEAADEWSRVVVALGEGLARMPAATYAVWYPLTARARVAEALREVVRLKPPPCYVADVTVAGPEAGLKIVGCGMLVINPPWGSEAPVASSARWLGVVLAQAAGGRGDLRTLVAEAGRVVRTSADARVRGGRS